MRWGAYCVLAAIAAQASATGSTWIRLSSPSIEIFTDCGENTALGVLHRFEALRRAFDDFHGAASRAPVRVFIFATRSDYLQYAIDRTAGIYQSIDGQDQIVTYQEAALRRVASHEYLHLVMRHSSATLPHWLDEGIADFYSTISIGKTKMRVGDEIEEHLSRLSTQKWLDAEDLAVGNPADGPTFYAESWALVHMLTLAPAWKAGMPRFVKLLNDGREQQEAFSTAFGKSMEEALTALRSYVRKPAEVTLPAPPVGDVETSQVTRLDPVDSTLALADLALSADRGKLARSLFLRAAKNSPQSPAAVAGLGSLALAESRKEDARRELERAVALGYRDPGAYFELAMLTNDNALLEKTLELDPKFAQAHFLLGVRETDSGNFQSAIQHLRDAIAVEPRRFSYWHALGYAQAKSGDRQGAGEAARKAAILASNGDEEQLAAALTQLAQEAPVVRGKKPAVITPPSWQNRKGDAQAEGTLTSVDCNSSPVRLVLSTAAKTITLHIQNPREVELLNAGGSSATLVCGEQSQPVAVQYVAATGDITQIEFKHVIIKR
jgi:Flp pilus assembly protein TadD